MEVGREGIVIYYGVRFDCTSYEKNRDEEARAKGEVGAKISRLTKIRFKLEEVQKAIQKGVKTSTTVERETRRKDDERRYGKGEKKEERGERKRGSIL